MTNNRSSTCSHGWYGAPEPDCEMCQQTTRLWNRCFAVWILVMVLGGGVAMFLSLMQHGQSDRQKCPCCRQGGK